MAKQPISSEELKAALGTLVKLIEELPEADIIQLEGLEVSIDGKQKVLKFTKDISRRNANSEKANFHGISVQICINVPGVGKVCF